LLARFNGPEVNLQRILSDAIAPGAEATVMVVGSIAKGFGRPESDVDLLLMVHRETDIRRDASSIVFRNGAEGRILSHKYFAEGIEFGVDVCSMEGLSGLIALIDLLVGTLHQPQAAQALPVLSQDDIRFLDAVRNGWVIHHPALAEQVRRRLQSQLLPLYCASFFYIQHLETLEDCYSLHADHPEVFAANVRLCAHRGALSLLGVLGVTDPNERWTWKYLHRLLDGQHATLSLLQGLYFRNLAETPGQRIESLRGLRALGGHVHQRLTEDPAMAGAVALVRKRVAYAFDEELLQATTALPLE
jgi:hypothetical protein